MRVGWLSILAACGRLGFDAVGDGGTQTTDGKRIDAGSSSGSGSGSSYSGSGCLSPGIGDNFQEISPCSQWGQAVVENSALNVGSDLLITPSASTQSTGGCLKSSLPFGEAGFFVHVGLFPNVGSIQLMLTDTPTSRAWGIESIDQTSFQAVESGQTPVTLPFDLAQQWWRIRPSNGFAVYETSPDGETWETRYTTHAALPATLTGSIEDVVDASAPDPAIIDGIDICP